MRIFLPFLAGALIMWLLLQTCNKHEINTTTVNVDSVQHINDSLQTKIKNDSITHVKYVHENDSIRIFLNKIKEDIETRAAARIVQLTFERNKFRTAAEGRDTVVAFQACERFMKLYDSTLLLALSYKNTIDSLQNNTTDRRSVDSIQITILYESLDALQKQVDYLLNQIKELIATNDILRTQLAKSKRGKWIIASLAAIGGGIIGHSIK